MSMGYPPRPAAIGAGCANHPERPADTLCSRCGDFVCGACFQLAANGDVICNQCEESQPIREPLAWEQRSELGVVDAWVKTLRGLFFSPLETLKRIEPHGSYGDAIWFVLTYALALGVTLVAQTGAQFIAIGNLGGGGGGGGFGANPLMSEGVGIVVTLVAMLVLMPVFTVIGTFVNAGLLHLSAMIVGAGQHGYRGTFRMVSYVGGLQVGIGVLFLLTAVVGVWHFYAYMAISLVSQLLQLGLWVTMWVLWAFGLKEVHQTTIGRGLGAVGVYFGGMILLCCGFYALILLALLPASFR